MPGPTIRSFESPADGHRPRVVVVGTGHGGMECVKALKGEAVDVLMVDRNNYHKFQPLLYQVATAGLDSDDITQSARHLYSRQGNADVRMGTVVDVDLDRRELVMEPGPPVPYDWLVLAPGASTAYYGVEGAQRYGFPLKNVPDAVALRSHILRQFEAANRDPSLIEAGALRFVVVGGGATGVETAGALTELFRVLDRDFPGLDVGRDAEVILLDGGDALMQGYKPNLQAYTKQALERRGVDVRLGQQVEAVSREGVRLGDGTEVEAGTVVWTAGVRANPVVETLGTETTSGSRAVVDEALRVPGHPEVFVVGDAAGARDPGGELYPQVAQVAIQQGTHAAAEIRRAIRGLEPRPFHYTDLGMMATIGRNAAIVQLPSGFTMKGFIAWLGWAVLHVVKLAGFRNQLSVLLNWAYSYFTYDRGPRLILAARPEHDDLVLRQNVAIEPEREDPADASSDPVLSTASEAG
ncbi:MAG: NAD(P)/FAD-dependent oxidoreductase [Bacteroidota bacterium]